MQLVTVGTYANQHLAPDRKPHQYPTSLLLLLLLACCSLSA